MKTVVSKSSAIIMALSLGFGMANAAMGERCGDARVTNEKNTQKYEDKRPDGKCGDGRTFENERKCDDGRMAKNNGKCGEGKPLPKADMKCGAGKCG